MTRASPTTSDESIDLSTSYAETFLTASEIQRVESDPFLSHRDVWTIDDPPTRECVSCGERSIGPDAYCPDCAREEGRR